MKERLKTYIEIILVTGVLTFIAAISVGVLVDVFWASDPKAPEAFRGGFIGAFFAFLFVRLSEAMKRIDDRRRQARRALIALEHGYNRCVVELGTNRHLLQVWDLVAAAAKTNGTKEPIISNFNPVELSITDDPLLDLTNLELLNEAFNLNLDLRGMNRDLQAFARNTQKIANAYMNSTIDRRTFDVNVLADDERRREIELHLDRLMEQTERVAAAVAILAQERSILDKVFAAITRSTYPKGFEEARDALIKRSRAKLAPMREERKREVEEIAKRARDAEESARPAEGREGRGGP